MQLVGQQFGRWTVLAPDGARWLCACECGTVKPVWQTNLLYGRSRGCIKCSRHDGPTKHGLSRTRTWRIWVGMIQRCHNPNNPSFANYGGRGIYVCERWRSSVEAFHADMGDPPDGKTLDRVNNDGPYSPENCRWATRVEQAGNTRHIRVVEVNGRRMTLAEAARVTGIGRRTIAQRLANGWTMEDAVSRPVREH